MKERISLYLTKEQKEILKEISRIEGFSTINEFLRFLIKQYLLEKKEKIQKIRSLKKYLKKTEIITKNPDEYSLSSLFTEFSYDRCPLKEYKEQQIIIDPEDKEAIMMLSKKEEKNLLLSKLKEYFSKTKEEYDEMDLLGISEDEILEEDNEEDGKNKEDR